MSINWARISTGVMSGILISLILYGSYRFYFDKPIPIVNNQTFAADSKPVIKQSGGISSLEMGIMAGPVYLGGDLGAFAGGILTWNF